MNTSPVRTKSRSPRGSSTLIGLYAAESKRSPGRTGNASTATSRHQPTGEYGFSSLTDTCRPPSTTASFHPSIFIACSGLIHGPPLEDHPGQL